jgi:hypothetical protein
MLHGLDSIPWTEIEHAYGPATDVPGQLRRLLSADPDIRADALWQLYGNVFHQGTRFPAAQYVVPFLIEMCASPQVPERNEVLLYWGSLITGYFSIQQRPCWGDGERIHVDGRALPAGANWSDDEVAMLHGIYRESVRGHGVASSLLVENDEAIRASAAWLLACLPTLASTSIPQLQARIQVEKTGSVRAAIAFALGELGAVTPLREALSTDPCAAVRCMAACQLARIEPNVALIEPLLHFISNSIDDYESIPGAGGKSTGDAAFSVSHLPLGAQRMAIPAICDQLDQARSFDTIPLVASLLSAAFPQRREAQTPLNSLQRCVLARMVNTDELWSVGNHSWRFKIHGLPWNRVECAALLDSN